MRGINKAIIIGHVGNNPNIKIVNDNFKIANLSVATSIEYKKNDQKEQETTWHNVSAYGKVADIIERFVKKGDLIYVEGRMANKEYTDKNNEKKYRHEIVVHDIKFLHSKNKDDDRFSGFNDKQEEVDHIYSKIDDIPF